MKESIDGTFNPNMFENQCVQKSVDEINKNEMLSYSGHVTLPLTKTFYSTFHAALTDKFGVNWNIVAEKSPYDSRKFVSLDILKETEHSCLCYCLKNYIFDENRKLEFKSGVELEIEM